MPIFYNNHLKVIKVILNFPGFASACQKSAQFIHSTVARVVTAICDHTHRNIFLSTLNFWYQHAQK